MVALRSVMHGMRAICASILRGAKDWHALDFGRPTQREAFGLTVASLVISAVFWTIAVFGSMRGYGTPTVVAV